MSCLAPRVRTFFMINYCREELKAKHYPDPQNCVLYTFLVTFGSPITADGFKYAESTACFTFHAEVSMHVEDTCKSGSIKEYFNIFAIFSIFHIFTNRRIFTHSFRTHYQQNYLSKGYLFHTFNMSHQLPIWIA